MKPFGSGLLAALMIATAPSIAAADPKPATAKPAKPAKVIRAYAGKTDIWADGCSGGMYYSPEGQARAWCSESRENFGAGTWSVSADGVMCQDVTWYWPNQGRAGSSQAGRSCIEHVTDWTGQIWRSWPGSSEWWPMDRYSSPVRGFKFRDEVYATRSSLGL